MIEAFNFRDRGLVIDETGPMITEAQIDQAIPEEFPGKDAFVAFQVLQNGVHFLRGAVFYRELFHEVSEGDYNRLEVEYLYFVPRFPDDDHDYLVSIVQMRENLARRRSDLRAFVATHLPVACDASGNAFWIELSTGRVKYVALEDFESERDVVDAAPTFRDFVANIQPRVVGSSISR